MKIDKMLITLIIIIISSISIPALLFYGVFRQLPLSKEVQDWSNFGSYIGGVYSALFGFLSTVIVCLTLFFTIRYNKEQIEHIKKQHSSSLVNLYANTLNEKLDKKIYEYNHIESGKKVKNSESTFLSYAVRRYNINHAIEAENHSNKYPNDKRIYYPNVLRIGMSTLSDLNVSYNSEIGNLKTILDLINSNDNPLTRRELLNQFQAVTHRNRMFWLMLYAYFNIPSARESIAFNEGLLIAAEGLERSTGCSNDL